MGKSLIRIIGVIDRPADSMTGVQGELCSIGRVEIPSSRFCRNRVGRGKSGKGEEWEGEGGKEGGWEGEGGKEAVS